MATPDAIGTCKCGNCAKSVYVRKNRGSFAYYRCEHCTFEGRFHNIRHSDAFVKSRVSLLDDGNEEAGKKPEIPASKPVASAALAPATAPKKPDATPPAPPAKARSAAEKFLYGEG